jgi:hypothetical protein
MNRVREKRRLTQPRSAGSATCTRPLGEHQDCRGGSLRVFRHFSWLEAGSVKAALSRPAHRWALMLPHLIPHF